MSFLTRCLASLVFFFFFFFIIILSASASKKASLHGENSEVVALTSKNFREMVIESNKMAIVLFYTLDSPLSLHIGPIFDVLAKEYSALMLISSVDLNEEKEIASYFKMVPQQAPIILLFGQGLFSSCYFFFLLFSK